MGNCNALVLAAIRKLGNFADPQIDYGGFNAIPSLFRSNYARIY